jgi:hypothetical protein
MIALVSVPTARRPSRARQDSVSVQIEPLVLVDYQPELKGVWQGVARVGSVLEDLVSVGISNRDYKSTFSPGWRDQPGLKFFLYNVHPLARLQHHFLSNRARVHPHLKHDSSSFADTPFI